MSPLKYLSSACSKCVVTKWHNVEKKREKVESYTEFWYLTKMLIFSNAIQRNWYLNLSRL